MTGAVYFISGCLALNGYIALRNKIMLHAFVSGALLVMVVVLLFKGKASGP